MSAERELWEASAEEFALRIEPTTLLLARCLLHALDLGRAASLLEVGGGAGAAARVARSLLPTGARLVTTDFSRSMLALARRRLPPAVAVAGADAARLPFAAGSFDRYLANLNLMLVGDADAALAEAARILRPGGLAAWSVWGRPEHSPMFTLVPRAAKRLGIVLPERRSNFHLGDREALRARVARAGFRSTVAWHQTIATPARSGAQYLELVEQVSVSFQTLQRELPAERAAALRRAVIELADQTLAAGEPIALDALVVVGQRQSLLNQTPGCR